MASTDADMRSASCRRTEGEDEDMIVSVIRMRRRGLLVFLLPRKQGSLYRHGF